MNSAADSVDVEQVDRLFMAVAQLSRRLRREAPTALSHGAIVALGTVYREGPLRLGDLAVADGVRAPTMSRIVDGLVEEGFVERVPDPADRRACLVRATAAGEAQLRDARSARSEILAARVANLPEELRDQLFGAIPALEALSA
jgi:DNA-binding MarR family transcriptional regulator